MALPPETESFCGRWEEWIYNSAGPMKDLTGSMSKAYTAECSSKRIGVAVTATGISIIMHDIKLP
jgi:hypothetical protein